MEKWDAYLANGHKTNHILIRGQSIPDGFYHLAVKCLVQHLDGSLLFMQRHLDKKLFPGFLRPVQQALPFTAKTLSKLFGGSCWKKRDLYQLN
ncbi:hypothetical protein ACQRC3_03245 [Streptococcus alactolyticus]|uniref:hypothetical protein n=1 Tax=Streptococcus alactolyticus TaxID=29389 RepID=UPI003D07F60D